MRKRALWTLVPCLALSLGVGVASGAEISQEALVGTWEHVSISATVDGPREPVGAEISWAFEADGTGVYTQTAPFAGKQERPLRWELDGAKILLKHPEKGKVISIYTVVEAGEDEMTWRNETLGDFYHVERE